MVEVRDDERGRLNRDTDLPRKGGAFKKERKMQNKEMEAYAEASESVDAEHPRGRRGPQRCLC